MIKLDATSTLPTRSGEFIIKVFSDSSKKEHVVLVKGEIKVIKLLMCEYIPNVLLEIH